MLDTELRKLGYTLFASPFRAFLGTGIGLSLLWVYWPTLEDLAHQWGHDPKYSHGYIVPLFALVLLWLRRQRLEGVSLRPAAVSGSLLLAAGLGLRLFGTFYYLNWFQAVSLLPCLAGIFLLFGGWAGLRWSWPAIGFLVFMLPLPFRLEIALAHPLQRIGTRASTYALQTIGLTAHSEGNVIFLKDVPPIGVVEACSGLSMLVTFFALSAAVALLIHRPWLDKFIILASAVPIALVCNIARITITGILYVIASSELAHKFFHDLAGLFMMPMALVLLWLELKMMAWVLIERRVSGLAGLRGALARAALAVPGKGPQPVS